MAFAVDLGTKALLSGIKEVISVYHKHQDLTKKLTELQREAGQAESFCGQVKKIPLAQQKKHDFAGIVVQLQKVTAESTILCHKLVHRKKKFPNSVLSFRLESFLTKIETQIKELSTVCEWLNKMLTMASASELLRDTQQMHTEEEKLRVALETLLETKIQLKAIVEGEEEGVPEGKKQFEMVERLRDHGIAYGPAVFWVKHFGNKIGVSWKAFSEALSVELAKHKSIESNKQNMLIWAEVLDPDFSGIITVSSLKQLNCQHGLIEGLEEVLKKKKGIGRIVEVRGWNQKKGTYENCWMNATIMNANERFVQLKQHSGTNALQWRKRTEIRNVGGIQPGIPIEIFDMGGWFTTEIISVINDDLVYLDSVEGHLFSEPIALSEINYRLLGWSTSFKKGLPKKGDLIQVKQTNSYYERFENVGVGLEQWFDAVVEDYIEDEHKFIVEYVDDIPIDEEKEEGKEEEGFGFGLGKEDERETSVSIELCRPYACLAVGDRVEVVEGTGNEIRWHEASILEFKGTKFQVRYKHDPFTVDVLRSDIRPIHFISLKEEN